MAPNVMTKILLDSLSSLGHKTGSGRKKLFPYPGRCGEVFSRQDFQDPATGCQYAAPTYRSKPDLCIFFISLGMGSFLVDAILLAILRLLRVRYLLYAHGVGIQKLYDRSGPLFRPIVRKTCVGAVGALVLGETLKSDLADFMAAERMYVLPNALPDDPGPLSLTKSEMSPIRILFLSNLKRDKGPLEFLKMASQIHVRSQSVRFVLAGPEAG